MDIRLQDNAGASEVILPIAIDEEGRARWRELRAPKLPPRQSQGTLSFSDDDPLVDFVWSQDDWSDGALRAHYNEADKRYSVSDDVDLRWDNVAGLGPKKDANLGLAFINPGGEQGDTTGWTAGSGVSISSVTTEPFMDTRNLSAATTGSLNDGDPIISQDLIDATLSPVAVWQGKLLIFRITAVRDSGTGTARMFVNDGVGKSTSGNINTGNYGQVTVTRTIDASATEVTVGIEANNDADVTTWHIGHTSLTIVNEWKGFAEVGSSLYTAGDQYIAKWDSTNLVWRVVNISDSSTIVNDIVAFQGNVYVSYASGSYRYGKDVTWTASTRSDPDDDALHWALAPENTEVGLDAIWKSETSTAISHTTDGINGAAAWSAPLTVGSSDRTITALHSAFDTILVSKQDGLWLYGRVYAGTNSLDDRFYNVAPNDNVIARKGIVWQGWLYLPTVRQGLFRYQPGAFQDISSLFASARIPNYGGNVQSIATDTNQLFILMDTADDNLSSTTSLVLSMQAKDATLKNPHTIGKVSLSIADRIHATGGFLYVVGRISSGATSTRWTLPDLATASFNDQTPSIQPTGTFDTSTWHGQRPSQDKAFLSLTIWCEDLDSTHTIKVSFGIDGAVPTTTTLTTFNGTGQVQTAYFHGITTPESNAIGKMIQLRFQFDTNNTTSPKLYAFGLHSTLRLKKLRVWEVDVVIGKETMLENGYMNPVSKSTQLSLLDTLEDSVYPLDVLHEFDEEREGGLTTVTAHLITRERLPELVDGYEIHRLTLQEARTAD